MKHSFPNNHTAPILAALAIVLTLGTKSHATNLVGNGSFEAGSFLNHSGGFMLLPVDATEITGWTVISDVIAWGFMANSDGIPPAHGSFFLDLQGPGLFSPPYGGVSQTIPTVIGKQYRLSFQLGTQEGIFNDRGPISVTASGGDTTGSFTFAPTGPGGQWGEFGLVFTATNAGTVISIVGTLTTGGAYIGLDQVSVEAAPDRPSLHLLAPGGQGAATVRLTGQDGFRFAVDASANLETWLPVATNTVSGGFADYTDAEAGGAFRCYRGRWIP